VGHLYLTNKPGGFTAQDEMLAELFARQAAMVISNARFYQDREAWATVAERERIGRELHDGVLQTLYGLTLSLEYVLDTETSLSQATEGELHRITETLSLTMTDIRMYIQSLGATSVDFKVALTDMLQRSGGITDVHLDLRNTEYLSLKPEVVHDLVLSVQEAVSNARRHGAAASIRVGWDSTDFEYQLWIQDDGKGFDDSGEWAGQHFGLINMRRRMERWQGTMDISSEEGHGTLVMFRLPKTAKVWAVDDIS
jgi:signal transduction histidine kinase